MRQTERPTQTNRCSSGKIRERKRLKEKKTMKAQAKEIKLECKTRREEGEREINKISLLLQATLVLSPGPWSVQQMATWKSLAVKLRQSVDYLL